MRPVFFELTLWNDPQKGAKRPAEWDACRAANRSPVPDSLRSFAHQSPPSPCCLRAAGGFFASRRGFFSRTRSHTLPAREAQRCRSRRCCSAEPPSTCGGMRRSASAERQLLLQPPVLPPIFRGLERRWPKLACDAFVDEWWRCGRLPSLETAMFDNFCGGSIRAGPTPVVLLLPPALILTKRGFRRPT